MDEFTIRLIERVVISLGGILSIYLGYRLFSLSKVSDSSGTIRVSDAVEVGLKRVGPGVFFALFGAFVLYTSLDKPVHIGSTQAPSHVGWMQPAQPAIHDVLAAIEKLAADLPEQKKTALLAEVTKLKTRTVENFMWWSGETRRPTDELLKGQLPPAGPATREEPG